MRKVMIALTVAAVAMTGLMANKCVLGDVVNGNSDKTQTEGTE